MRIEDSSFRPNEAQGLLNTYKYQPDLTKHLDALHSDDDFSQHVVNEIVLWKLNRYVCIPADVLAELGGTRNLKQGEHRKAGAVLAGLLGVKGVDLPMASTFLRFRNSSVFQILDRHAYRALYRKPFELRPTSALEKKVQMYFEYLDNLLCLCRARGLDFVTIDRVLYLFDKLKNGKL